MVLAFNAVSTQLLFQSNDSRLYTKAAEQWTHELASLLKKPSGQVDDIIDRISLIAKEAPLLRHQAAALIKFVPSKLNEFCVKNGPFFRDWEWMMYDDNFQDPFHRFYAEVRMLCSRKNLTTADYRRFKDRVSELPEADKQKVLSKLVQGPEFAITNQERLGVSLEVDGQAYTISVPNLQCLMHWLESEFLKGVVAKLSSKEEDFLKRSVEIRALAQGVVIENWDLDWRHYHLFDCPLRLISALSQVTLRRRNETLFRLWCDFKQMATSHIATRLLMECPLIEDVRNGRCQLEDSLYINELRARIVFLNRLHSLQARLELKYPSLKRVFEDLSHPISKGMHEKLMQVILSALPLFGSSGPNKLVSSLEAYFTIVNELALVGGITEADAEYLLEVTNNQYALKPGQRIIRSKEALMQLLNKAKSALRGCQLIFESAMVRLIIKEEYELIYLLRKDDAVIGKFKPLPTDSAIKELLGGTLDALLGTYFVPASAKVWLSVRKELLSIRSLLVAYRHEEAIEKFNLLSKKVRQEIYFQIFDLKKPVSPPYNYGELAWHSHPNGLATREERIEAIDRYLDPKQPLKIIYRCFEGGDVSQAMELFQALDFGLKHLIYYHCFLIKNPTNSPDKYGEWAWNGHPDFPLSNEERLEVLARCLALDSLDQFVVSRDPKKFHHLGTLQNWAEKCVEGGDLIYKNPLAGRMFRSLPVSLVQMYNILGILKGAGDCHPGNTLFQFDAEGQIANLIDCDDELIMPNENHIGQIKIWTLGFPQASIPLLRPIVGLLASSGFRNKCAQFIRANRRDPLDLKFLAFEQRVKRISRLCSDEFSKSTISLTCQDLCFELYGGRKKFEDLKQNKRDLPEFILFHYFISDGAIQYFYKDKEKMRGEIFSRNVQDLYS